MHHQLCEDQGDEAVIYAVLISKSVLFNGGKSFINVDNRMILKLTIKNLKDLNIYSPNFQPVCHA